MRSGNSFIATGLPPPIRPSATARNPPARRTTGHPHDNGNFSSGGARLDRKVAVSFHAGDVHHYFCQVFAILQPGRHAAVTPSSYNAVSIHAIELPITPA